MTLPAWTEAGLLPPGIHAAELPDLYDRFVLDAPHRDQRELLYAALTLHLRLVQATVPSGLVWINGSFCTRRAKPPKDVDVVIKPTDWDAFLKLPTEDQAKMYGLLTLQEVHVLEPVVYLSRLQPVGGTVDAFLCRPGTDDYWHGQWSRVRNEAGKVLSGKEKGFVEVTW